VTLKGADVTGTEPYHMLGAGVAYLPQRPSLFPYLTVESNLKLGLWHARVPKAELRRKLEQAYTRFPTAREKRHQPAGQLSGGQQRQVEIARSLLTEPPVYLIDEPTAGIDPRTSEDIYELIASLARDAGKAILLVDQDIKSALAIADYVSAASVSATRDFSRSWPRFCLCDSQALKILVNAKAPTAGMAVRGFPTTFGSLRVLFCCQTDQHHSK
jgi:ABC-type branched-subunit amino acid transport system ATPase component